MLKKIGIVLLLIVCTAIGSTLAYFSIVVISEIFPEIHKELMRNAKTGWLIAVPITSIIFSCLIFYCAYKKISDFIKRRAAKKKFQMEKLDDVTTDTPKTVSEKIRDGIEASETMVQNVKDTVEMTRHTLKEGVNDTTRKTIDVIRDKVTTARANLDEGIRKAKDKIGEDGLGLKDIATDTSVVAAQRVKGLVEKAKEKTKGLFNKDKQAWALLATTDTKIYMNNKIIYKEKEYILHEYALHGSILDIDAICKFGLSPARLCDMNSYVLTFKVNFDDRLLLTNLTIYTNDENTPYINGVKPQIISRNHLKYSEINLQIKFSWVICITDNLVANSNSGIENYGVIIPTQSIWSYLEVIELVFSKGICIKAKDISKVAEENRAQGMHLHRKIPYIR